jgi:hypothetical protein
LDDTFYEKVREFPIVGFARREAQSAMNPASNVTLSYLWTYPVNKYSASGKPSSNVTHKKETARTFHSRRHQKILVLQG